ncbi:unnamed protein product [Caretta caretta]
MRLPKGFCSEHPSCRHSLFRKGIACSCLLYRPPQDLSLCIGAGERTCCCFWELLEIEPVRRKQSVTHILYVILKFHKPFKQLGPSHGICRRRSPYPGTPRRQSSAKFRGDESQASTPAQTFTTPCASKNSQDNRIWTKMQDNSNTLWLSNMGNCRDCPV